MMKVVFIITFSPKYIEYGTKKKPRFNWTVSSSQWVGIWGLDWGDLLLKALVEHYPDYECEVWQPDRRADKVYTAQLQERLVHHNFPATMVNSFKRFKMREEIYSDAMLKFAREYDNPDNIFLLPATVNSKWLKHFIGSIGSAKKLYFNFLNEHVLLKSQLNTFNPIKAMSLWLLNMEKERWLGNMRNLLTGAADPIALAQFCHTHPHTKIFPLVLGFDQDFWARVVTKECARQSLHIPNEAFVIVLSQRLVPEYQIDKFISAVSGIKTDRQFICYITGHGLPNYESYLQSLILEHDLVERIKLVGYVSDEDLRSYFIAADLFVTVPLLFGGSNGALKAMAVETPVLHVDMGTTYEFLKAQQAGEFVSNEDYDSWTHKLQEIISGKSVKVASRQSVLDHFSWKKTADQTHFAINNLRP